MSTTTMPRGRAGERRQSARRPAERVPVLAGLTLDELRAYRAELVTEESRVSYWRRLVHARLDLTGCDARTLARMRELLTEHQRTSRRLSVLPLDSGADPAPLPDLEALWTAPAADTDPVAHAALLARLSAAEVELSTYRRSLHERLDEATSELIARYRDEPALALRALPLPRTREALSA